MINWPLLALWLVLAILAFMLTKMSNLLIKKNYEVLRYDPKVKIFIVMFTHQDLVPCCRYASMLCEFYEEDLLQIKDPTGKFL